MPTSRPTEAEVVELVRHADAQATTAVSKNLWARVESQLDAAASATPPPRRFRVVHSRARRVRRLAAVAAVLLAVFGVTWFIASRDAATGTLVAQERLQRDLDRKALEGPLELDGTSRPLGRDLYRGVAIEEGTLGADVLQACNPC